ncbi:MAG: cation transporter [Armatimonadota bacterium]|nr:cation transporter [Armatimonadota bacterium]
MDKARLQARALLLSYITVAYNTVEGLVSIAAGILAGSAALLGFGVDSFFESLSGAVMVWRFKGKNAISEEAEERTEKLAVRLVGYTFVVLGAYVLYESVSKLATREAPERSLFGVGIAIASIIVMPALYLLKLKTGEAIASQSLVADSKETLACCLMSVTLLVGLGLNYLLGWWWADPLAGLVIVGYLFTEAHEALVGKRQDE